MVCPQVSCFDEYYEMILAQGSTNFEVEVVILSIMFGVSLQVLFVDEAQSPLQTFNLDYTNDLKVSLSAIDNGFDVCYRKDYIDKAAFIQRILKCLAHAAVESSEDGTAITLESQLKGMGFKQMYTNHEYLNWL